MKLKLTWLLTLFMAFVMQFSFAQEKDVTGTVTTAEDGLPLPGASVSVKGTQRGTQTDFDGKYSIKVSSGEVLVISYVGMKDSEVTIGSANTYDVVLEPDTALDEVVVVGYGTTTKKAYAGTAKVVNNEDIETKNFSNVSQSLAGEAAGVTVINTSGQPGTTSTVRIRGFGSINGNRAPLYVIDGVPYSGSLNAINPADIKSTTILKDATATAIYGSRGANGVILITTKGGSSTESYIELDVRTGINAQLIPRYDVVQSPEEAIGYVWEGLYGKGRASGVDPIAYANNLLFSTGVVDIGYNMWNVANASELIDPATRTVRAGVTRRYTPLRYTDAAFDAAYRTEANLRMGGGNADSRYFVSLGFLDDDGYSKNTGYKRYTTRINVNSNVKEWLTLGANLGYAYSEQQNNGQTAGSENVFEFADKMQPFFPVYLRDQNYQLVPDIFGGFQFDYGAASVGEESPNPSIPFRSRPNANLVNPIGTATYDFVGTNRHELNGSFNGKIKITDDLTFETTFGAQYSNSIFKSVGNPYYGTARNDEGNMTQTNTERLTTNFLQLLRYRRDFGNHSLEALVAHEGNKFESNFVSTSKTKVVNPDIDELSQYILQPSPTTGGRSVRTLESYFGQINYDFNDTYYLTLSGRRDGSSKFAFNKWENFYSIGGAWIISNEDFMSDSFINFLKLKASYGTTGDEAGVGFYTGIDSFTILAPDADGGFVFRDDPAQNPNITWETAVQYQAGIEFSLGNWLDGSIDYFIKDTENLFFTRTNTISTGVATLLINEGVLRNNGLEFDFTGHIINSDDFKLDLTVNGAMLDNEIREMYISPQTGEQEVIDTRNGVFAYSVGSSIFDFYTREWAGVDPSDGAPMWWEYYDDQNDNGVLDSGEGLDGVGLVQYLAATTNENPNMKRRVTKEYSDATEKYVGKSAIPDVSGAFRLSAKYKNWNLSTQFTYQIGGYALDNQYGELMSDRFGAAGNNYHTDIRGRWQNPGDVTNVPALTDNFFVQGTSGSTRFLTKSDFLALNNILLGYTLPSKFLDKTGLDLVNIYVSGDNLWLTSARNGFNPRTSESGNTGRRLYAPLSTFTLGVKLKF